MALHRTLALALCTHATAYSVVFMVLYAFNSFAEQPVSNRSGGLRACVARALCALESPLPTLVTPPNAPNAYARKCASRSGGRSGARPPAPATRAWSCQSPHRTSAYGVARAAHDHAVSPKL